MMLPGIGLWLIISIVLCVHVVRTHREMYWLFIILMVPTLGALVYVAAVIIPELFGGRTARRFSSAARETLDPDRAYRQAKVAHDDSPTVANAIRLAAAAMSMGRFAEAEALYGGAARGVHAEDPTLLLGRASALIELGRFAEALVLLERLETPKADARSPTQILAFARAYEGLGRNAEAEPAYDFAAGRLPGLEGLARQAAFLARTGRKQEAAEALAEMDRRIQRADPVFRKEARTWRDLAARALAG
jgi:hypothetical protein